MEKIFEFKKGEVITNDELKGDLAGWFTMVGDDYDQEYIPADDTLELTILRDFTITIKLDYPPTTD